MNTVKIIFTDTSRIYEEYIIRLFFTTLENLLDDFPNSKTFHLEIKHHQFRKIFRFCMAVTHNYKRKRISKKIHEFLGCKIPIIIDRGDFEYGEDIDYYAVKTNNLDLLKYCDGIRYKNYLPVSLDTLFYAIDNNFTCVVDYLLGKIKNTDGEIEYCCYRAFMHSPSCLKKLLEIGYKPKHYMGITMCIGYGVVGLKDMLDAYCG